MLALVKCSNKLTVLSINISKNWMYMYFWKFEIGLFVISKCHCIKDQTNSDVLLVYIMSTTLQNESSVRHFIVFILRLTKSVQKLCFIQNNLEVMCLSV